jgi:hypothetical protein
MRVQVMEEVEEEKEEGSSISARKKRGNDAKTPSPSKNDDTFGKKRK